MPAESDVSAPPVSPGDVLAGKYRVERVLGAGGMGVVVSALHLELDERVAVKFLLPEVAAANADAAQRFLREARAACRIKSEHVARVIDVGRLESGAPYMVMEYLEGCDLGELGERETLSIEDAVDYLIQACHAMAEAHAVGIVHRDLKPANLFLVERPDGTRAVKVLDFGISKTTSEIGDASLTRTSSMMGSPLYMSPEQMRSARDVDARTDIWALGVVLYQLLTGHPPFLGDSLPQLISRIMTEAPSPMASHRIGIPAELEAVVLRCLKKSPEERFRNVGELAGALLPFGSRRSRYTAEGALKLSGVSEGLPTSLLPETARSRAAGAPGLAETAVIGAHTSTTWAETGGAHAPRPKTALGVMLGLGVAVAIAAGAFVLRPESSALPSPSSAPRAPTVAVEPPLIPPPAPPGSAKTVEAPRPEVAPATIEVAPNPNQSAASGAPSAAPESALARPQPRVVSAPDTRKAPEKVRPEAPAGPPPPAPPPPPPASPPRKNPLAIELK
jgi:serine/threonine-protein kinase